ncbi:hypothetical protein [Leucobacter chromiiresistens]|uniref:hypothetical protein n=1 Tax=Leucobacter chromiiresistens TaxID=1079994 RepID=UPI00115FC5FB|nr:hypothetical protein [Leucobacter chromiiresistens]
MDATVISAMIAGAVGLIVLAVGVITDRELSRRIDRLTNARNNLRDDAPGSSQLDDVIEHLVGKLHRRTVAKPGKRTWADRLDSAAKALTAAAVTVTVIMLLLRLEDVLVN